MAPPTSYTESTLKTYMITSLGTLASALGLVDSDMAEPLNDVLLAYGVSDIADADNMPKLRALARVHALRRAQTVAATWTDFSADGASFSRSQVLAALKEMLLQAEASAMHYGDDYAILTGQLTYADNPYPLSDDTEEYEA